MVFLVIGCVKHRTTLYPDVLGVRPRMVSRRSGAQMDYDLAKKTRRARSRLTNVLDIWEQKAEMASDI